MAKKKKIIVDSSVIVKWLSSQDEKHIHKANKILKHAKEDKIELFTSELAKYEVGNTMLTGKGLSNFQAFISLETLYNLPLTFISETEESAQETYALGQKLNLTYYDAAFISLAKKMEASLITDDKDQARSSEIKVVLLSRYK